MIFEMTGEQYEVNYRNRSQYLTLHFIFNYDSHTEIRYQWTRFPMKYYIGLEIRLEKYNYGKLGCKIISG